MQYKYGIILFLLSCYMKLVSSIRCYDCNSNNNSMCVDPTIYDAESLARFMPTVECGRGLMTGHQGFFCRKIMQTVFRKGYEPDIRVTRSCGWIRHNRDCYKADNEDHLETVCQCFSDNCNGAKTTRAAIIGCFVMLLVKYIVN